MNKPLKGVGYDLNATNRGFSLDIHAPDYSEPGDGFGILVTPPEFPLPAIPYLPIPQFQCFAVPGTDEYVGKTILKIVCGGVNYTNTNLPLISEGVQQNFSQAFITKAAVLSTGVTAVPGAVPFDQLNPFMLSNGFYTIDSTSTKHYVVLSYYDGNGVTDFFDVPILTQRTPWVSIVAEGSAEFDKLFIEQGPSYYNNFLNIAPMVGYTNDDGEVFGQNHTGYFKPIKFGANVRILATVEDNLVTQSAHGTQNLAIPLLNHGTSLVYAPGMTYYDDPYNRNSADDFNYVVNKADIEALSSLSFSGAWWSQITDNSTPRAVTVHNYSYYSVNFEGTDNMREFSCAVVGVLSEGESPTIEHRLRIKNGLVTFTYYLVTNDSTADPDNGGWITSHATKHLRINKPNLYPTGTLYTGDNLNPDYIQSDGYIKLDEGSDYYVFLYKVTPDWDNVFNEAKAPQLVISKVTDDPNTKIVMTTNGGGTLINYTAENRVMNADLFGWNASEGEWQNTTLPLSGSDINFDGSEGPPYADYFLLKGFKETGCYRKDIAVIKWNSGENRFKVYQLHNGPVMFIDAPTESEYIARVADVTEAHWDRDGDAYKLPTADIYGASFSGYTFNQNTAADTVLTSSTDANKYLSQQPSQIENPDIT